ncbi:HSF-type DNA-binding-domain-containing protein, partial [Tribonema minus]
GKRGAPQAFPRRLYELLQEEDASVVSWIKNGEGFIINDMDTFVNTTLVKYFQHNKYTSFQRQCNLYGFRKITRGPDAGMYIHEHFKKGRLEDLVKVRR